MSRLLKSFLEIMDVVSKEDKDCQDCYTHKVQNPASVMVSWGGLMHMAWVTCSYVKASLQLKGTVCCVLFVFMLFFWNWDGITDAFSSLYNLKYY